MECVGEDGSTMEPEAAAGAVVGCLRGAGHAAYFVGGCVRDALLGLPVKDIDIATSARPEQVAAALGGDVRFVGRKFGVSLVRRGGHCFEVATFRRDGAYLDHRHPCEVAHGTMEDDAARRDFTINALYREPESGAVVDLHGGVGDLRARVLRCVGDPRTRFREDALRLLRAVRFAARLGFTIEPATWDALCDMAPTIEFISPERHREELTRILTGPRPGEALRLMERSGLLHFVLPEIEALRGVEQGREFHPEGDVFDHTCLVLEKLDPRTPLTAWGALLHDVGKPATFARDPATRRISFLRHHAVGAEMAEVILTRLRFANHDIDAITTIVRRHMMFMDVSQMKLSTLRQFLSAPTIQEELAVHRADCLGSNGRLEYHAFCVEKLEQMAAEAQAGSLLPAPLLTGRDLLAAGVPPGPRLGRLLAQVRERQLNGELDTRDEALEYLQQIAAQG